MMTRILVLLVILSFSSCKQELPDIYGTVQGVIINELTEQPQPDIKVYLLDQTFRADSVNSKQEDVMVDSMLTDQNGFYLFDSLAPSHYTVVPFSLSLNIVHVESTDPYDFEISASEKYQVDYIAQPNAMSGPFTFDVHFINVPYHEDSQFIDTYIIRRHWIAWCPTWINLTAGDVRPDENNEYHLTMLVPGGYTVLFYTLENYFDIYAKTVWSNYSNFQPLGAFVLETSILDFSPVVKWEFDCESETLTRIQ